MFIRIKKRSSNCFAFFIVEGVNEMKTFLCEYIHEKARKKLESFSEIIEDWSRFSECDAVINRNLQLTREVLQGASNLKVIAVHGTGLDGVDLEAAKEFGISVCSTPYRNAVSVAELNIALMLMTARKVGMLEKRLQAGDSFGNASVMAQLQGIELSGKRVAFLGVGEIAKRTISICKYGFSMQCIGWSRSLTKEKAEELGIEFTSSRLEAIKEADFVVLGMALTEETRGIFGKQEIEAMKQGAIVINTARGALIQEDLLYEALKNGKLGGAGLDVLIKEPFSMETPLYRLENVVLTPHIGANTEDALYRVGMACVEGIRCQLDNCNKHLV